MIGNTRTLSPTVLNEFRFGFNSFFNTFGRELAYERDVVSELAHSRHHSRTAGVVGHSGHRHLRVQRLRRQHGGALHQPEQGVRVRRQPVLDPRHALVQAGRQASGSTSSTRTAISSREGRSSSTGAPPAPSPGRRHRGLRRLPISCSAISVSSEAAVALATTRFRAISQSYYFNDTWRMRRNMTLDYGLRYEYTPPWLDKGGTLINAYLPYQRPGAARRGPVASSRADPDRLRRLLRGAECPVQSEHPGRPRRHPGRASDRRRQVEFRSAGRMGLDAQRRVVGPGRRRHLLHAGHRQSAVRHGAQRGRASSGHVGPAAVESELGRAVRRVGHESLQRAAARWSASRSTTCSATCTTARPRT